MPAAFEDRPAFADLVERHALTECAQRIARPTTAPTIRVQQDGEQLTQWHWEELFDAWWSVTHAMQKLRDNPDCADEERSFSYGLSTDREYLLLGEEVNKLWQDDAMTEYWRRPLEEGRVLIYSPVADPQHSWGLAIVQAESTAELEEVFEAFAPEPHMQLYHRGIRRRLAPMLGNDRRRLELAYSLLFALPVLVAMAAHNTGFANGRRIVLSRLTLTGGSQGVSAFNARTT